MWDRAHWFSLQDGTALAHPAAKIFSITFIGMLSSDSSLLSVTIDFIFLLPHTPKEFFMASDLVKHVTDATFEVDVLQSARPILVDYWAEWCGPCKMIAPILDEVSLAYEGRLQIAKMNVDENRDIPAKFGIRGIPTLMLFKDGKLAATKVGALSKSQLVAFIDEQM
jgi:thioredoxin 1